jgi:hypothetical protein
VLTIVNINALYFTAPLAVVALTLWWASGTLQPRQATGDGTAESGAMPDGSRGGEDPADGWGVTILAVVGMVAALLVVCGYGLYVATFLLD